MFSIKPFHSSLLNSWLPLVLSIFLTTSLTADNFALLGGDLDNFIGPNLFDKAYQARVSFSGEVSNLTGETPNDLISNITSVSISRSGAGLIGGGEDSEAQLESFPYAAIVSPSGVATRVTGQPPIGEIGVPHRIQSVSINRSGVGLIGGGRNWFYTLCCNRFFFGRSYKTHR